MNRALVICSGFDLKAEMLNSTACAEQMLRAHDFVITRCVGPDATREGILAAYTALIASCGETDAAVVYYTGHGGLAVNKQYTVDADLPRCFQHICPTDYAKTKDGDFRGISSLELSLLLAALTGRTPNATTIFECCFAAQMTRGGDAPAPPAPRPQLTRVGVTGHLRELRERARQLPAAGNRAAVRVSAAGQTESAVFTRLPPPEIHSALGLDELPRPDEWIGAMTLWLARLLIDAKGKRVPWRAIAPLLRSHLAVQRPEIAGPDMRLPFSLEEVSAVAFAVREHDGGARLEAGTLLGVSKGDVYGIMPQGSSDLEDARLIANLTIDEADAFRSSARRVQWCNDHSRIPPGAVAVARSVALAPYPVRIDAPDAIRDVVAATLQATGRLRGATDDEPVLAEIRVSQAMLEVRDELGPLSPVVSYPAQLDDAVQDILNLATVKRLRDITPRGISEEEVSVVLGVVGGDGAFRAIANGEALGLGDRIALRLHNTTDRRLWASVFNVGLRRTIARIDGSTTGIELPARASYQLGNDASGQLVGCELTWPAGLPRDQPRADTIMTIVTARPVDLAFLETTSGSSRSMPGALSVVALFDELATTRARGRGNEDSLAPADLAIVWRHYQLSPIDTRLVGTSLVS